MDNIDRAEAARSVLTYFCQLVPNDNDVETLSTDLICNLRHLAESKGIDFHKVLARASEQFDSERGE